ncbi:NP1 [Bocaparvovirus primate3]|uniref:Non-structural protein NP-1 n=1 Tax=Bocaparvovirus primate3 TaxID=3052042 RepID=A0A517FM66_9VIRU|nr:NP1 [Bocaparvovirus primate3]QDS02906.1 NP1 [Bocaparvovirus primate3]
MSSESTKARHRASKRSPSPLKLERKRNWDQKRRSRSPIHRNGEKNLASSAPQRLEKNQSFSTASKTSETATTTRESTSGGNKTNPYTVFSRHRAANPDAPGWCGFYWHSTRIARDGTNEIFNRCKQQFQELQVDNKLDWDGVKEILFANKKIMDQKYRNMFWHFRNMPDCNRCDYWDDVYRMHLAKVSSQVPDVSDEEMLAAAEVMDSDASN